MYLVRYNRLAQPTAAPGGTAGNSGNLGNSGNSRGVRYFFSRSDFPELGFPNTKHFMKLSRDADKEISQGRHVFSRGQNALFSSPLGSFLNCLPDARNANFNELSNITGSWYLK